MLKIEIITFSSVSQFLARKSRRHVRQIVRSISFGDKNQSFEFHSEESIKISPLNLTDL